MVSDTAAGAGMGDCNLIMLHDSRVQPDRDFDAVWSLNSPAGIAVQASTGIDLYRQFGALDRAAEAMLRATRRLAS